MTNNDVENNVYELDNSSIWNNQRPRPYLNLETNAIEHRNPGFFLFDLSHGFRFVFKRILLLDRKYKLGMLDAIDNFLDLPPSEEAQLKLQGLAIIDKIISDIREDYFPDEKTMWSYTEEEKDDVRKKALYLLQPGNRDMGYSEMVDFIHI